MKSFIFVIFVSGLANAITTIDITAWTRFDDFVRKYNKTYLNFDHYNDRLQIFTENLLEIDLHNTQPDKTWRKGVNEFTDLTGEEFKAMFASGLLNVVRQGDSSKPKAHKSLKYRLKALPEQKDWRDEGVVSGARDQGQCGSCWAFATIAQLESYLVLNTGKLESLSPQQLTSCAPNPMRCGGTGGCSGSTPQVAYTYTQMMGVVREEDYPYISGSTEESETCVYDAKSMDAAVYVRGYETLPHNDYAALIDHIAFVGPLAVSVDASNWHSYEGGVFDNCSYDENIEINHAVQLVGYGTDDEHGDYWIVKNSWGAQWAENGYIRLKRESTAVCGTDSTPSMGTACEGDGNAVQKVCGMCGVLFDTSYPIGTAPTSGIKP